MAIFFEEKEIIRSSDGVQFEENAKIIRLEETPEQIEASKRKELAIEKRKSHKPLAVQLAEAKERKDEDWKSANNPFAPPPGLDEEDFQVQEDRNAEERLRQQKSRQQLQVDKVSYEHAVLQSKMNFVPLNEAAIFVPPPITMALQKSQTTSSSAILPVRVKSKSAAHKKKDKKEKRCRAEASGPSSTSKKSKSESSETGLGLLAAYSSDSDE